MSYRKEELDRIYEKTKGHCHLTGEKVARKNYGKLGKKGAWEVDHGNPNGVDDLRNLSPARIDKNRQKQDLDTQGWRRKSGVKVEPEEEGSALARAFNDGFNLGASLR